jgi:transposase
MTHYPHHATERAMKVQEVMLRAMSGQLHWIQAAEILGISDRSMRRWRERYERWGYDGLFDRRWKRPSPKRMPFAKAQQILTLYRERYRGWNVAHFHDQLREHHRMTVSYHWVKLALQGAGLVAKAPRRGGHRLRRARRPLPGMLLFQDASTHAWWPTPDGSLQDLLVTLEDATSEVYDAIFVPQENTVSVLAQLERVVEQEGVFCSLYTDKASHFITTRTGQSPHRPQHATDPTQVQRALQELGIALIPANSPQARGRMERLWGTWQGRLPQELALRGIHDAVSANRFLREHWLAYHRRHWSAPATQTGTAFVPCHRPDLERIFAVQHERTVANDNTIQYGRVTFQLAPSSLRVSFAKCRVTVYEHLDETLSIGYGPHGLGRYQPDGTSLAPPLNGGKRAHRGDTPRSPRSAIVDSRGSQRPNVQEVVTHVRCGSIHEHSASSKAHNGRAVEKFNGNNHHNRTDH